VGLVHLVGAREGLWVGTRFAIPGFSHELSLMLTRLAGESGNVLCLPRCTTMREPMPEPSGICVEL